MAAPHACSPYAPPRFVTRAESLGQKGELLGAAIRNAIANGARRKAEGYTTQFALRAAKDLEEMLPMDLDEVTRFFQRNGWITITKNKETGEEVIQSANRMPEELGYANAVLKTHLEASAGATKQLADNFLMKVKAGEDATVEGLRFAAQMQSVSRLGSLVLGWDQQLGRGLQSQGILGRGMSRGSEAIVEGTGEFLDPNQVPDIFASIAAKLQDANRQTEGVDELIRLAKRVQFLDDPHKISKASMGLEAAGNAWTELFINGMLSSPSTVATNLLGAVWVPARAVLQLGAAEAWAASGLFGAKEAKLAAAEATASLAAMYSAVGDALQVGWHAMRTDTSLFQKTYKPSISGENLAVQFERATRGNGTLPNWLYDNTTKLGEFVRLPSRAVLGVDEFAKFIAYRGELAARGVRRAVRNGGDLTNAANLRFYMDQELKAAFNLRGEELTAAYGSGDAAVLRDKFKGHLLGYNLKNAADGKAVTQTVNEAVFQEDNPLADSVQGLLSKAPILRPFVPFVRTPLNIIKQGVWESSGMAAITKGLGIAGTEISQGGTPTQAILAIQQELLKDPAETARMAGQIAFTAGLVGTVYGATMSGKITGGGPGRWTAGTAGRDAQNAWIAAGNVPYSIEVGGQRIPFDRFGEPIAIVMRMAADVGMHAAWMEQQDQEEALTAVAGIAASALYQASFLQGVDRLVKVFQTDNDQALSDALQTWVAAQTPFGGLLGFVDRVSDPYKSAYEQVPLNEVLSVHEAVLGRGILSRAAARFPGVDRNPGLVDQLTGRPVPIVPGVGPGGLNPLQMAIPVFPRQSDADPVWQAVFDIRGSYREMKPSSYKLTTKEQQQLNGLMAQTTVGGKTLSQRILEFRRRADVQQFVENRNATLPGAKFKIEREFDKMVREHFTLAEQRLAESSNDVMNRIRTAEARSLAIGRNDGTTVGLMDRQMDELLQRARRGY